MSNSTTTHTNKDVVITKNTDIRTLRHLLNKSQEEIAMICDITRETYSNYERGLSEAKARPIFLLAAYFSLCPLDVYLCFANSFKIV